MVRSIFCLAVALVCQSLFGQIELTVKPITSVGGLNNPQAFGSHLLVDPDSQPSKQSGVLITATGQYKSIDVEAESKPAFDLVDLILAKDRPDTWLLIGSGKYRITAYAYDPERGQARKRQDIEIDAGPMPPDPPKPDPTPDPKPDETLPIEGQGLRVLIVYESSELSRLPESQKQILTSVQIRDYLNSKCPVENGQYEYRFLDQNADMKYATERWKKAMSRQRLGLPWIAISNGVHGFEGVLPSSVPATLEMLKRYGGK